MDNPTGALRRIMAQFVIGFAFFIALGAVWFLAIQLLSLIGPVLFLIPVILVLIWSAGFIIWKFFFDD